jgi:hypothetical protein
MIELDEKALEAAARAQSLHDAPQDEWGDNPEDDNDYRQAYRASAAVAIRAYLGALAAERQPDDVITDPWAVIDELRAENDKLRQEIERLREVLEVIRD